MSELKLKHNIAQSLHRCLNSNLADGTQNLFQTLGYQTDKAIRLDSPTAEGFCRQFDQGKGFNPEAARAEEWQFVDLVFQLTKDEITGSDQIRLNFEGSPQVDNTIIESYLFFAIALSGNAYARSQLATITREINKLFAMPVLVVFQHGQSLTLSIINRRLHKRDGSKDVLEKVTLIKDIDCANPHRAHVEILFDLSLAQLYKTHRFSNFVELHRAWQKTLDSTELNKRFFQEISDWYFWARQQVRFPNDAPKDEEGLDSVSLIRLITRLIFVWFLKEKRPALIPNPSPQGERNGQSNLQSSSPEGEGFRVRANSLVPEELFRLADLKTLIDLEDRTASTYYKAILQNLFFATLNQEMNTSKKPDSRKFRGKGKPGSRDQHFMVHNVYRYHDLFKQPEQALQLFEQVPFLNGGLFECLDQPDPQQPKRTQRVDGFSDRADNPLTVPNYLFFSEDQEIDLNQVYGTKKKRFKVRGLIDIFSRYKFTITENTPLEEEIALDPELLGKVFENLLAAYNPETRVTARKQTGSFYTPREVVDYMVDESLLVYLENALLPSLEEEKQGVRAKLRQLLDYKTPHNPFTDDPESRILLIAAIDSLKVLDPAVGSGAFPMGMLQKLVFILGKLDPNNEVWKYQQKEREIRPVLEDLQQAQKISYEQARKAAIQQLEERLAEIEADFTNNEMDYPRKLFLIENSIYGVDIQPIAVQIAKLRFFISLIVEQRVDDTAPNRGILPLPNLETKFIAANTLMGIDRPAQMTLGALAVQEKEQELAEVRHRIFTARTQATKNKWREKDQHLREEIAALLKREGWADHTATQLAQWNPYDQNASAGFFDPEWMFGIRDGFDVCIGNPPYVRQEQIKHLKEQFKPHYECFTGTADLYVYFYERGLKLLREHGVLTFISSNKYFRSAYGQKLRHFLASQTQVHQIIDFGDAPVFTAIAYPTIVVLEKGGRGDESHFRALNWEMGQPLEQFETVVQTQSFEMPQAELKAEGWQFADSAALQLLEKLRQAGTPLGEYVNNRFYYGIKTGFNEAFVVDRATRDRLIAEHPSSAEVLKPFLRGRDVKRWAIEDSNLWLLFIPWHFPLHEDPEIEGSSEKAEKAFKQKYPAVYNHLLNYKTELSNRNKAETGIRYEWYALQRCAATYWQEFERSKIIYPDIYEHQSFAIDLNGFFAANTCYFIPTDELWLCGLLNSQVIEWFYRKISNSVRGGYLRAFSDYIKQIPIPPASEPDKAAISTLVSYILHLTALSCSDPSDKLMLDYFGQLINGMVYELYLPADLHTHNLSFAPLLQAEALPALDDLPGDKLAALRAIFQRLYATDHPLRRNLFLLDTLPTVRIIEGKD
jgi:hypothetical protein